MYQEWTKKMQAFCTDLNFIPQCLPLKGHEQHGSAL